VPSLPAVRQAGVGQALRRRAGLPAHRNSKDAGRHGTNKDTVAVIVMFIGTSELATTSLGSISLERFSFRH